MSANVGWIVEADGCHIWQGSRTAKGYGQVRADGRTRHIHKVRYEREVGPVPEGMHLDHFACDNGARGCCNPAHMRPVTPRENMLRSETISSRNLAKTHCPQGHPYTADNLVPWLAREGQRKCDTCYREARRLYRERNAVEISERKRKEYLANREGVRTRHAAYYRANRERLLAQQREYHARKKAA